MKTVKIKIIPPVTRTIKIKAGRNTGRRYNERIGKMLVADHFLPGPRYGKATALYKNGFNN